MPDAGLSFSTILLSVSGCQNLLSRPSCPCAILEQDVRLRDADYVQVAASVEAGLSGVVSATVGAARWPRLLAFCHSQYAGLGAELFERQATAAAFEAQRVHMETQTQAAEVERLRLENEGLQSEAAALQARVAGLEGRPGGPLRPSVPPLTTMLSLQ